MGARARAAQVVSDLFGFASVVAASLGDSGSVELAISANEDDASGDTCEMWGHAPLLYRPLVGSELLYATLGSERVVFATKERKYQISVADGEVILRAVGPGTPAYVHLKPDGSVIVAAQTIKLGAAATQFVALANLVAAQLTALKNAINVAVTVPNDGGASFKSTLLTALSAWPASVAATKTKAE